MAKALNGRNFWDIKLCPRHLPFECVSTQLERRRRGGGGSLNLFQEEGSKRTATWHHRQTLGLDLLLFYFFGERARSMRKDGRRQGRESCNKGTGSTEMPRIPTLHCPCCLVTQFQRARPCLHPCIHNSKAFAQGLLMTSAAGSSLPGLGAKEKKN